LKHVFAYLPFVYYLSAILFLFFLLVLRFWGMARRPSMERVARGLEEKFPQLRDDVTNSLLLFHQVEKGVEEGQISIGLVTAHLKKTAEKVSKIPPNHVVSLKRALRYLRLLLPLLVAFSAVLALDPHFLTRSLAYMLHPFSTLPMSDTFISVEPKGGVVLRGTPLTIKAQATGNIPDRLNLTVWPEGGEASHLNMESESHGSFVTSMASAQKSFRYQASSRHGSSPVYTLQVVEPPDIGRITVTLFPPDYTRLPKQVRQEGHIEALKGTVAHLEARTNKPVKEGKLILHPGNPLALQMKGDRLTGSLVVLDPGAYSFLVKDELGFENPDPVRYRIHLIPDKYPEAEIVDPSQDLEVSGTEAFSLSYTARDDFGITAIRLSYQMGGTERFITLKEDRGSRSLGPETFRWDLSSLALTPGDRVTYRIEVWDNDTVSGPKVSYSRAFTLSVRDDRNRASQEVEEAQHIADALLDLLANQVEEVKDRQALSVDMKQILEEVDRHLKKIGEDRMQRFDLEALRRNLDSLEKRIHEEPTETVTREMERLALLSEEIAKKAKMNEVDAISREIRNRQRRLMDALRDQKGPLSSEALQAMLNELDKLRQLLQSVMEALSKMASQLPSEFMNSSELNAMEFQDLFKDLDEIQKQLMAGDLNAAMEAAQRLLQALSEMMAALSRAGAQANMGAFDRLQSEMSRQTSELDKILGEQRGILNGTERIDLEARQAAEREMEKRLKESRPKLQEKLERLEQGLPSEQRDSVKELERLLQEGQLERFSQLGKDLEKSLSRRPDLQKQMEELMKMAEGLVSDPKDHLSEQSRERFPRLSSREKTLEGRTEDLVEKLEMLSQLFPGMDTDILKDLKEAAESMGKASGRLQGEDAPGAIPPEQEAIRFLTKSQQAMQQMSQQMAMQMQANRWGYPLAYDPRPGWYYGPWVPMPTLPQPELRRPREKGYTGIDREEFDPPSKDAYKAPQVLREKVMEGLKENVPVPYRREVERYFRGLTE
jgi:hypothetical protein